MDRNQIGIYVNSKEGKVVRITSPYWIPEKPDWEMVTNEPNATLVTIKEGIKEKGLMPDPSAVSWGEFPIRE